MPRLPRITPADLLRALRRDGWYVHEQTGGHIQLKHATKAGRVTVPAHVGRVIPPGTLKNILDQADLTADDLRGLL